MSTPTFFTWPTGAEPLVERFTELTALETGYNGTEHRRPCRAFPRYGLSATFLLFDSERGETAPLETNLAVLVPAWMHRLTKPDNAGGPLVTAVHREGGVRKFLVETTAGKRELLSAVVAANNSTVYPNIDGPAWLPGMVAAYPLVEARLDTDSFGVEVVGPDAHSAALSFQSDSVQEPIPAYTGPTSGGLPMLVERLDWSVRPRRETGFNANTFDNGHLSTFNLRHAKRTVPVQFTCLSREAALELRQFLRQLRGRYQAFRWVGFDGFERTYRLASDTWEMQWRGCATATCSLRFVELEE